MPISLQSTFTYKLAVDARLSHCGIGRYLTELVPLLEQSLSPLKKMTFQAPIYSIKEQCLFPFHIPACDLLWSPHFNVPLLPHRAKKHIVTLHDTYHLDHPFPFWKKTAVKLLFSRAIAKADQIITVSSFSKKRLLFHFPSIEEKLHVIGCGADHLVSLTPQVIPNLPSSFFLFVGTYRPHKNLKIVLETMNHLKDLQLVLVGKIFASQTEQEHFRQTYQDVLPRLHFLGFVSDEKLCWLYTHAKALLFPSFYEGFGLPPLEAMSLGCAVLSSSSASLPEVCADAACYFDPYSVEDLCQKICQLPQNRQTFIQKGKKQASLFSWQNCAEKHFQVFGKTFSS